MKPYYQKDGMTLYCGDCEEVLSELSEGAADLIFTSPPYNLGNAAGGWQENRGTYKPGGGIARNDCWSSIHKKRLGHYATDAPMSKRGGQGKWVRPALSDGYDGYKDAMPHADYVAWQHRVLLACWNALSSKGAIYYNHKPRIAGGEVLLPTAFNPDLPLRQVIIWNRSGGINFTQTAYVPFCEWIMVLAKPDFRLLDKSASGVGDVWTIAPECNNPHPAPFPLELPLRAISTTKPGIVLDPFAGSGTTMIAAKKLGREAIGIEKSEKYCEIIVERLEMRHARTGLFEVDV